MVIHMHKINIEKFNTRCDLIKDSSKDIKELNCKKIRKDNIVIERIEIDNKLSRIVNKRKGNYVSILFDDITDYDNRRKVIDITTNELRRMLKINNVLNKKVLVVGLGNCLSTPDSLGPKTIDNVIVTRHLFEISKVDNKYNVVAKLSPGVYASTGIETFDIIKGIINRIDIDYLIVVDSLLSTSKTHINKLIQITDSGIDPGSGVENQRKELTKKTLNKPVIAIGIPTVIDIKTFTNNKDDNLIVTPKEIDFVIDKLSIILSKSINNSVHNLTN